MLPSRPGRSDRRAYDQALADGFQPSSAVLGLLFLVFAVWHAVEFELDVARVMVPIALATAALCAGAYVSLGRRPLTAGRAHPLAALLAVAAYLNCVVQLALTGDPHLTVNVLLLIVAIGVCLVDPLYVTGLCGGLALTWAAAIAVDGTGAEISRAVADLLIGLIVAAMANILRRRTLSRLLQAQAKLRELSERCELTGLLNRRGFLDAAERLRSTGAPVTVWFIDVDDLKQVNDSQGHDAGDLLLRSVARALEDVFSDAVVGRLSGDEFAVVETEAGPDAQAGRRARLEERLAVTASSPTGLASVSTGTATSLGREPLAEVLTAADAAMYVGKQAKRQIVIPSR